MDSIGGNEFHLAYRLEIIHDLNGVEVMSDDMLIYGCGDTYEEALNNNEKLEKLLLRLRDSNLKLNKENLMLCKNRWNSSATFLNYRGVKADPSKIEALIEIPRPRNTDLLSRLHMKQCDETNLANVCNLKNEIFRSTLRSSYRHNW